MNILQNARPNELYDIYDISLITIKELKITPCEHSSKCETKWTLQHIQHKFDTHKGTQSNTL